MDIRAKAAITFSSRQFNQDTARAKRAAKEGPVFITDRGETTHVLLTKAEFDRLTAPNENPPRKFVSLAEALADNRPEADFEWKPPRLGGYSLKIPDFE